MCARVCVSLVTDVIIMHVLNIFHTRQAGPRINLTAICLACDLPPHNLFGSPLNCDTRRKCEREGGLRRFKPRREITRSNCSTWQHEGAIFRNLNCLDSIFIMENRHTKRKRGWRDPNQRCTSDGIHATFWG